MPLLPLCFRCVTGPVFSTFPEKQINRVNSPAPWRPWISLAGRARPARGRGRRPAGTLKGGCTGRGDRLVASAAPAPCGLTWYCGGGVAGVPPAPEHTRAAPGQVRPGGTCFPSPRSPELLFYTAPSPSGPLTVRLPLAGLTAPQGMERAPQTPRVLQGTQSLRNRWGCAGESVYPAAHVSGRGCWLLWPRFAHCSVGFEP